MRIARQLQPILTRHLARGKSVLLGSASDRRFVELAAREAGRVANYSRISQDVGVSAVTIQSYYDILCDCLIAERVEPVTRSASRKKLTKASRFPPRPLRLTRMVTAIPWQDLPGALASAVGT